MVMNKVLFNEYMEFEINKQSSEYINKVKDFKTIEFEMFIDFDEVKMLELGLNGDISYSSKYSYSYPDGYGLTVKPHYKCNVIDLVDDFSVYNLLLECIKQDTYKPDINAVVRIRYDRIDKINKLT